MRSQDFVPGRALRRRGLPLATPRSPRRRPPNLKPHGGYAIRRVIHGSRCSFAVHSPHRSGEASQRYPASLETTPKAVMPSRNSSMRISGTTQLRAGYFHKSERHYYVTPRVRARNNMKLAQKIKIALDETRILVLGAQILLGFQLRGAFQELYSQLPAAARYLNGLALLL